MNECHMCNGTGKDSDAVNAASYPDHCVNCGGNGKELPSNDCPLCGGELEEWYFENNSQETWVECSRCDYGRDDD